MTFNILKNLFLLIAAIISVYVLAVKFSYSNVLFLIISCCCFIFLVLHVTDLKNRIKRKKIEHEKYLYFTLGYITKRIILIGAFSIISFVFFISGNKIFLFGVLVLTLLVAEIISLLMSFNLKTLFIELRENQIYISENQLMISAKHILEIEYRHNIFYLTLKNNKTQLIDTSRFYENAQEKFSSNFKSWILQNQIAVGEALKKEI